MFNELDKVFSSVDSQFKMGSFGDLPSVVFLVTMAFIYVAIGASSAGLAYGFVQFIISQGDPKNIEKARNAVLWSSIALVISLIIWQIKNVVFHAIGL